MGSTFIPERTKEAPNRTLVVLLDGTGDREDEDITNVCLLWKMLYNGKEKHPGSDDIQVVHYATGIGADVTESYTGYAGYAWGKFTRTALNKVVNIKDQAVADSFQDHLIDAYKFLVKEYREGDKICIFGFSRGAYTARALAGMLNAMGLLKSSDIDKSSSAYSLYAKHDTLTEATDEATKAKREAEWVALQEQWKVFRSERQARQPFIEFLGCWDSVNSVGLVSNIKLAFTATNDIVKTFRHALALDERRAKFRQNMWSRPPNPSKQKKQKEPPRVITDVEEVWFAGCHCDVGGGSVPNGTRPNLAHISLRWMIRECFKKNTGIIFNASELVKIGLPSDTDAISKSRSTSVSLTPGSHEIPVIEAPGWVDWGKSFFVNPNKKKEGQLADLVEENMTEDELDERDAFAPMYDQLVIKSAVWNTMESLFLSSQKYDEKTGFFVTVREKHNGIGRTIPPAEETYGGRIKVHRSVQMRMQGTFANGKQQGQRYLPTARVGWGDYENKKLFEQVAITNEIEWVA